jgi:hypothetical protein
MGRIINNLLKESKNYRLIASVRKQPKKLSPARYELEDEFVSIEEFRQFTSLKIEQVIPLIIG